MTVVITLLCIYCLSYGVLKGISDSKKNEAYKRINTDIIELINKNNLDLDNYFVSWISYINTYLNDNSKFKHKFFDKFLGGIITSNKMLEVANDPKSASIILSHLVENGILVPVSNTVDVQEEVLIIEDEDINKSLTELTTIVFIDGFVEVSKVNNTIEVTLSSSIEDIVDIGDECFSLLSFCSYVIRYNDLLELFNTTKEDDFVIIDIPLSVKRVLNLNDNCNEEILDISNDAKRVLERNENV